ncbi:putative membrane protein [Anaerosolibacter carboniphilus]|uniref:Putative membrane protein n=1 Tax=Anaerosolibacter carboniphilus TaxID=1417629 RepID=A0A841L7K1_9FIRM|nr:hypothetical protein [Anaerosolibacter carboniphilus]MBB6218245.1 putative membrane protein [Anaerosolibacter carboniphilus]
MIGRLAGFILLLLCFFVLYLGSVWENSWMTMLGILLGVASAILIVISRMKQNLVLLEEYKAQLRELAKKPDDKGAMEKAHAAGVEYYKSKRDNRTLLPMDEHIIQNEIAQILNKKKKK